MGIMEAKPKHIQNIYNEEALERNSTVSKIDTVQYQFLNTCHEEVRNMQNRYTGDIGDFGKLGLLRMLASAGLTIGINWYLTPDERHNNDGRHVQYLNSDRFRECDEDLWLALKHIVATEQRSIDALQSNRLLDAIYFPALLDFNGKSKSERRQYRENWHLQALARLSGVDVVFADPDNGLVVPSAIGKVKENKYVKPNELGGYFKQGSSVVYYQHKARRVDSFYTEQHNMLIQDDVFKDSIGFALKFKTTSQRYYFFIAQTCHKAIIENVIQRMLSSSWGEHFCVL